LSGEGVLLCRYVTGIWNSLLEHLANAVWGYQYHADQNMCMRIINDVLISLGFLMVRSLEMYVERRPPRLTTPIYQNQ